MSDDTQAAIREEQMRAAERELEAKLVSGLDSGPAAPMTTEDWDELKRRVWKRERSEDKP